MADLKRTGNHREQIAHLKTEAAQIQRRIRALYNFLIKPKQGADAEGRVVVASDRWLRFRRGRIGLLRYEGVRSA